MFFGQDRPQSAGSRHTDHGIKSRPGGEIESHALAIRDVNSVISGVSIQCMEAQNSTRTYSPATQCTEDHTTQTHPTIIFSPDVSVFASPLPN